jgi:hypothetical protein
MGHCTILDIWEPVINMCLFPQVSGTIHKIILFAESIPSEELVKENTAFRMTQSKSTKMMS